MTAAPEFRHVLVVDDDEDLLRLLALRLGARGFRVSTAESAEEGLARIAVEPPHLVISDVRLPGRDGLALFEEIRVTRPTLPVILLTAHGTIPDAVEATSRGVFGYLTKPFDSRVLLDKVDQALRLSAADPRASMDGDAPWRAGIVYRSSRMAEVMEEACAVASSDASVLIRGDSGTGKEVLARAIHRASPRAAAPFVAINCGAIPEQLLESELFGHVRGAFTGAASARTGLFQAADGGTLFLDEIGDMPIELQTRLLRVLSDGHFYRVGGHQQIKANVRVIAATHQNIEERVKQGLFREDLFHRLNVIRLRLPTVKERQEDIPLLARHFLQKSARDLGVEAKRMSEATLKYISTLEFPGNVRQIENLCHWLTVMAPAQTIEIADLPSDLREHSTQETPLNWLHSLSNEADRMIAAFPGHAYERLNREFESMLIQRALAATGGRRIEAAQLLGIGRNTITRKIQEFEMAKGKAME